MHGGARAGERAQQVAQLDPAAGVEAGRRLVEEQHGRVVHQRAHQAEPLLLPAGQHVHRLVGVLRQARPLEQLDGARCGRARGRSR